MQKLLIILLFTAISGCQAISSLQHGVYTQWSPSIRKADNFKLIPLQTKIQVSRNIEFTPLDSSGVMHRLICIDFPRKQIIQSDPDTCWAASVAMLRQYGGYKENITEDSILTTFSSWNRHARHADYRQITAALIFPNPYLDGNRFASSDLEPFPGMNADDIVKSLSRRSPLLLGYRYSKDDKRGHLVVLYGVDFAETRFRLGGRYAVNKLHVFDPLPGVGHTTIELSDFEGVITYVMNFRLARHIAVYTRFPRRL